MERIKAYNTILVTGGTGFLGSRLVLFLLKKGIKVVVIHRKDSPLQRLENIEEKYRKQLFLWDISKKKLTSLFTTYRIEGIIHTATAYGRNEELASGIVESNVIFPLRLLELAIFYKVKFFINADTFFNERMGFSQSEGIYVKTKKFFLLLAKDMIQSSSLKFINMVIYQMYGPGDAKHKFIPFILSHFLNNSENVDLTSGMQKRDFIYVDDVVESFISATEQYVQFDQFEEFQIGTGKGYTIKSVVHALKRKSGSTTHCLWGALPQRPNEIMSAIARIKENRKLKWKSRVSLDEGMSKTVKFFKE